MRYDALVIGAGMSGLAAGIRLATAGKRVAILERHSLWGGLNSFFKRGGRRYDTGLHALTNYVPRGTPGAPLTKVLRQLRIPYEALRLAPQSRSETVFRVGGELVRLEFGNGLDLLRASVARRFPSEVDGFERLVAALPDYGDAPREGETARGRVREHVRDPLLAEMLLVAPFFYGCASEHDLAWSDFAVLFRSIHLEGMAYPRGGIKTVLDLLVERFRAEGGELRMRSGVARIECGGGAARGVVLDDGTELEAEQIYSSAGLVETRTLCGAPASRADGADVGRLSFVETCSVLSRAARELGHDATITFFNDGERFRYARPEGLIDVASGVITSTGNYLHDDLGDDVGRNDAAEGSLRVTVLADHGRWTALAEPDYAREKELAVGAILDAAAPFAFDPRPHTVARDAFTPRTVERYTGHRGGAIYGSPTKRRDGASGVANLHLIGTDQGLVGIVGALLSGIAVVHRTQSAGAPR